eukprot:Colp12_sorted_trinity150504_noHs@33422
MDLSRSSIRARRGNAPTVVTPENHSKNAETKRKISKADVKSALETGFWLAISALTFYFSDSVNVLVANDLRVKQGWLICGLALFAVNLCFAFYFTVYLRFVKHVKSEKSWDEYWPAAIPLATASALLGGLCLTVAYWPAWGILTPPILFILFMGFFILLSFVPL